VLGSVWQPVLAPAQIVLLDRVAPAEKVHVVQSEQVGKLEDVLHAEIEIAVEWEYRVEVGPLPEGVRQVVPRSGNQRVARHGAELEAVRRFELPLIVRALECPHAVPEAQFVAVIARRHNKEGAAGSHHAR
jgi:hypothetical protein